MPRLISFSMTTPQIRTREKDVTRRLGWFHLKPGQRLTGVVKAMGLKKGEKAELLAEIEVVSVTNEPLSAIASYPDDCRREGFPGMQPAEFVAMFCRHYGGKVTPDTKVTRIEFKYVDEEVDRA